MPNELENSSTECAGSTPDVSPSPPVPTLAPRDVWKFRDLLLFLAFLPFALLVANFLVLMGYAALRPVMGWHARAEAAQFDTVFLLTQQCVLYVFLLLFLFLSARLQHQTPFWKSLGWKRPTAAQAVGYLGGGVTVAVVASLALWLRPDAGTFPLEKLFDSRLASFALCAFAISLAPLIEEMFFRGLLFAVVERAMGWPLAVVVSALLFGALHIPEYWHAWHHVVMIFAVGMVFSLARGVTGSITPSIMLHVGYNSLIVAGLFFSTQHFRALNG